MFDTIKYLFFMTITLLILQLLEMEAMLSGAPDAFILVTKQWMQNKK